MPGILRSLRAIAPIAMLAMVEDGVLAQPESDRIHGLRSRSANGFVIQISHGVARDSTDTSNLIIPKGQTCPVDIRNTGAGGLDQGSAQPKKSYALWIVSVGAATNCVASLSFAAPYATFPSSFRRIGSFATDAAAQVIPFRQIGMGNERSVHYKKDLDSLSMLNNGRATTFTFVPFGYLAPVTLETVIVSIAPQLSPVTVRTDSSVEQTFAMPGVATLVDGLFGGGEYRNHFGFGRTDIYVIGYTETL